MEVTERGISRLVSEAVGVGDVRVAERTCEMMQAIARLEGVVLQRRQLIAAASVGASMRAFDDTFDECPIETADGQGLLVGDAVSGGALHPILDPRVACGIDVARDNFGDSALMALQGLASAQIDSVRQRRPGTPVDEIRNITRRKGAYAILLFALEVSPTMSPDRRFCYEELGYLVQLVDDYVDSTLDARNGVTTLITMANNSVEAIALIATQMRRVKMLFSREYSPEKLIELCSYVDRLVAGTGLLSVL